MYGATGGTCNRCGTDWDEDACLVCKPKQICQRCCKPILDNESRVVEYHYNTPEKVRTVHRKCHENHV